MPGATSVGQRPTGEVGWNHASGRIHQTPFGLDATAPCAHGLASRAPGCL